MDITSYPKEIQLFLKKIVSEIVSVLNPEYILIAGSFGKGSWIYFEDELISDFELVFVCEKPWSLKNKAQLLKRLNNKYPYEINLKGFLSRKIKRKVISNYALKNPGYLSLDFFDTFGDPVFLFNKNDARLNISLDVNKIPVWEAWRLYVNRMAEILKLKYDKSLDQKTQNYFWLKIFESTAEAYCIVNQIYSKRIDKRLEVFTKEEVDKNNELDENCKKSFNIIQKALFARSEHDLSLFNIKLSVKERFSVINSWMAYFEKKLSQSEGFLNSDNSSDFRQNYLKNKSFQKKYLGFNYHFNKFFSNSIRIVHNPKLLNFNFKFYNHTYSWRHVILLSISTAFHEVGADSKGFFETKKVFSSIKINSKNETNDFVLELLNYWRVLR